MHSTISASDEKHIDMSVETLQSWAKWMSESFAVKEIISCKRMIVVGDRVTQVNYT